VLADQLRIALRCAIEREHGGALRRRAAVRLCVDVQREGVDLTNPGSPFETREDNSRSVGGRAIPGLGRRIGIEIELCQVRELPALGLLGRKG
jgi:hypothetical protein